MTTLQDTMTDAAHRGREAFTGALRIWADSVHKFSPTSDAQWHGAVETVDTMFDFAEHMLTSQREFTKVWLAATTSAATKAAVAAQHVAEDMQDAAKETPLTRDMQDVDKETAPIRDMRDGAKTPASKES